jgi:bacterioferritin (cytochrome b1)
MFVVCVLARDVSNNSFLPAIGILEQHLSLQEEKTKMPEEGLKELYVDEFKDLYNAENHLVKALPKMAKAATSDLRTGFEEHLKQTRGHVERLETIFKQLDESPKGKKCKGMEGLMYRKFKNSFL